MGRVVRRLARIFRVKLSSSGRKVSWRKQRRRNRCRRKIRRVLIYVKIELRFFDERSGGIEVKSAKELLNMLKKNSDSENYAL
jgi:hypothetical protein